MPDFGGLAGGSSVLSTSRGFSAFATFTGFAGLAGSAAGGALLRAAGAFCSDDGGAAADATADAAGTGVPGAASAGTGAESVSTGGGGVAIGSFAGASAATATAGVLGGSGATTDAGDDGSTLAFGDTHASACWPYRSTPAPASATIVTTTPAHVRRLDVRDDRFCAARMRAVSNTG